jgi:hypothetical protein
MLAASEFIALRGARRLIILKQLFCLNPAPKDSHQTLQNKVLQRYRKSLLNKSLPGESTAQAGDDAISLAALAFSRFFKN